MYHIDLLPIHRPFFRFPCTKDQVPSLFFLPLLSIYPKVLPGFQVLGWIIIIAVAYAWQLLFSTPSDSVSHGPYRATLSNTHTIKDSIACHLDTSKHSVPLLYPRLSLLAQARP
jgi:hypothetical protein